MNLGATNHNVANLDNIKIGKVNNKFISINIANGSSMQISGCGDSMFSHDVKNFCMKDILLVSKAGKNLMSVKQLCNDNKISFEFDSTKV